MPASPPKTAQRRRAKGKTVAKSSKRKLPKYLSREEVGALMAVFNLRAATGLRDRCMFELMYHAGMRIGEVCALELRDVDLSEGHVRIVAGKTGDRTARFNAALLSPLLERWLDRRRQLGVAKSAPLFCTVQSRPGKPRGGSVDANQLREKIKLAARKAGLDPRQVHPHALRHSFSKHYLEDKKNVRDLQKLLGHVNLETTSQYLEIVDSDLDDKMRTWDPLGRLDETSVQKR